jgi:hypothetical protein
MSGMSGKSRRIIGWIIAAFAAASLAAGVAVAVDRRGSEAPDAADSGGRWFCPAKSLGTPALETPARRSCSAALLP